MKIELSKETRKKLRKINKKDPILGMRIKKKILEIKHSPKHFKPLKNKMKGLRRVHIDPFVIIFEIKFLKVIIHYIKHHDEAY